MAVDITALYCCLDDFCKLFADWEAHRLLPSERTRQRPGRLSRAGQPLVGTLADYLLPGAVEMPAIKIGHLHTPTPHTEYGMKGMGEGGAVAPPAAIANAVRDRNWGRGQRNPDHAAPCFDRDQSRASCGEL
jgi:hypothetical protein